MRVSGPLYLEYFTRKYGKSQMGLYRDDGLAAFRSNSQTSDRIRKEITKVFKDQGLNITIQANLKEVNFLDVTFNLPTDSYKPYKKPNDNPIYTSTPNPTIHPISLNSFQKTSASGSATYPPAKKFSIKRHRTTTTR